MNIETSRCIIRDFMMDDAADLFKSMTYEGENDGCDVYRLRF